MVFYRPLDQMYLSTHPPCGFGWTDGHVTSSNQGLSSNDQGRERRQTLETRLYDRLYLCMSSSRVCRLAYIKANLFVTTVVAPLSAFLTKVASAIILGIWKPTWRFQRQNLIFLSVVLIIVAQCSGTIFPRGKNCTVALGVKYKLFSLPSAGSC